jgi:hypothetical protein|nr:MAG: hypothetical protein [Lake Baikal virophage 8]
MVEIVDIKDSPKPNKRFRITLDLTGEGDLKHWDFGAKNGQTYIDHQDEAKRTNYLKRHCANPRERERIREIIPSPALFSAYILWGQSTDLLENLVHLNSLLKKKKM